MRAGTYPLALAAALASSLLGGWGAAPAGGQPGPAPGPRSRPVVGVSVDGQPAALADVILRVGEALSRHAEPGPTPVAMLQPVTGITIDGDVADWPADARPYPVELAESGVRPTGPDDLQAVYMAGYDESAGCVYVAVVAADQSQVVEGRGDGTYYDTYDGCEVYLWLEAGPLTGGYQWALWGPELVHYTSVGGLWRPPGSREPQPQWEGTCQVEARRTPGRQVYEWRIDVGGLTRGGGVLKPHVELGLDVAVCDRDADGSFSWVAWGPGVEKLRHRERMGRALLLSADETPAAATAQASAVAQTEFEKALDLVRQRTAYQMFLTGVLLSVTFLHLLLFAFNRDIRTNLYYALFTGVTGTLIYSGYRLTAGGAPAFVGAADPVGVLLVGTLVLLEAMLLVCILSLLFLYSLFFPRLPRRFWVLCALLGATGLSGYVWARGGEIATRSFPTLLWPALGVALLAAAWEMLRVVWRAVRQRQEGAWMMGVGLLVFLLFGLGGILQFVGRGDINESVLLAVLLPLASMSVHLGRSFSRTRRELLARNRALEEAGLKARQQYEQIQLQNQQIQEQNERIRAADRLKSEFLANISHDLRTPMNAIIGYTRILLRRTQGQIDERQYRNLTNVSVSAQTLLGLINDILDLSRIESGQQRVRPEPVPLAPLVEECVSVVRPLRRPGVELAQQVPPGETLETDREHLRRIVANLLSNAVKYTEAGSITVSVRPDGEWVEIAVADTGIGIPEAALSYIFDEFRQVERGSAVRREGSGLGLAIVRRATALLGGQVSATSQVGRGSVFTVRLPRRLPESAAATETPAPAPPDS